MQECIALAQLVVNAVRDRIDVPFSFTIVVFKSREKPNSQCQSPYNPLNLLHFPSRLASLSLHMLNGMDCVHGSIEPFDGNRVVRRPLLNILT